MGFLMAKQRDVGLPLLWEREAGNVWQVLAIKSPQLAWTVKRVLSPVRTERIVKDCQKTGMSY